MTEKELVNRAKIFQGNRLLDGDKVSMSDCLKIILLSDLVEKGFPDNGAAAQFLVDQVRKKYWFWKFIFWS